MSTLGNTSSSGGSGGRHSEPAAYSRAAATPAVHRLSDPQKAAASTITIATSTSSAPSRDGNSVSRGTAMPLYMIQSQQQPQQQVAFTAGMIMPIMNKGALAGRQASPSSSPPTPSPLSTSGSERHGAAAAAAQSKRPLAAVSAPGASGGGASSTRRSAGAVSGSDARLAAVDPISASIHAAAAAAAAAAAQSASTAGPIFAPSSGAPPTTVIATTSASPGPSQPSPLPPPGSTMAMAVPTTEEAAKEVQRQQILGLANALLTFCSIGNTRVTSIRQCTSSFFVLLYQRLFDCTIAGIDRSPNTAEKRRHNVMLVLEQLRQHPYSLEDIEAEEVVKLNEDHISRLIMVFVQVAEDMRQQQEFQQQQKQQAALLARQDAVGGKQPLAHSDHAEDFGAAKTTSGAYAPVGYTVAEVIRPPAPQQEDSAGTGGLGYHFHRPMDNFYVAPSPPLNGGATSGGGIIDPIGGSDAYMVSGGAELGEGASPSSVSHYLDSSVMPTDNLLEEWYRNLVCPPMGGSAEETEMMSAVDPGHVSLHGGFSQRRHPCSERLGREAGVSLTSSGSPLYGTGQRRASASPTERRSPVSRPRDHRMRIHADDIVRRFQRLDEALDAQERRHRKPFVDPAASTLSTAIQGGPVEREPHERHHPRHPAPQPVSSYPNQRSDDLSSAAERRGAAEIDVGALPRQKAPPRPSPQQPMQSHEPSQQNHRPSRAPVHRLVVEPPLTRQERYFLANRPQHRIDAEQRDCKIERLRSARYLGDMQQLLRQRMRREYDSQMSAMRGSLKESIRTARREKIDLMRRVRDENARYRAAYAILMEAAANEAQVPARVMSRHTAQLADYYATALQHSFAVCESLKQEADRRTKNELFRYAEEVSAWQQHFLM